MIIYLHGFSSSAASHKAALFKEAFATTPFHILDYPAHQPHAAVASITRGITLALAETPDEPVMLMGSSMGGFYAQFLAAVLDVVDAVIMLNPALQPQLTLKPYIGSNINMVTGEPFEFSQQDFDDLAEYDRGPVPSGKPVLVLLDEGDEVIDHRVAAQIYCNRAEVVIYPGGSHSFEHIEQAIEEIRKFVSLGLETGRLG